ncbi:hypothetical protein MNVI_30970 [Mycobacterium noviomagense]|uniref:Uncharacterized protein n=1 Tax=Mycobacterium noviomagense TaxID=459858 RepID=A0A7I7PGW6_9MYCO|nr:hypothetical protein MNVI_30970 [Mycobacterium noviomagense]
MAFIGRQAILKRPIDEWFTSRQTWEHPLGNRGGAGQWVYHHPLWCESETAQKLPASNLRLRTHVSESCRRRLQDSFEEDEPQS